MPFGIVITKRLRGKPRGRFVLMTGDFKLAEGSADAVRLEKGELANLQIGNCTLCL